MTYYNNGESRISISRVQRRMYRSFGVFFATLFFLGSLLWVFCQHNPKITVSPIIFYAVLFMSVMNFIISFFDADERHEGYHNKVWELSIISFMGSSVLRKITAVILLVTSLASYILFSYWIFYIISISDIDGSLMLPVFFTACVVFLFLLYFGLWYMLSSLFTGKEDVVRWY